MKTEIEQRLGTRGQLINVYCLYENSPAGNSSIAGAYTDLRLLDVEVALNPNRFWRSSLQVALRFDDDAVLVFQPGTFLPRINTNIAMEEELIRQAALNKLTPEEKKALGLR